MLLPSHAQPTGRDVVVSEVLDRNIFALMMLVGQEHRLHRAVISTMCERMPFRVIIATSQRDRTSSDSLHPRGIRRAFSTESGDCTKGLPLPLD